MSSPRHVALTAGRIAWAVTLSLALLFFVGLVVAQQVRPYCEGAVCLLPRAKLIELLHEAERAEDYARMCGWPTQ